MTFSLRIRQYLSVCAVAAQNQANLQQMARQQPSQPNPIRMYSIIHPEGAPNSGKHIKICWLKSCFTYAYFFPSVWFAVPTKFTTEPKSSVITYKNWDTILKCDIFGYPIPVIRWTRSRKQLALSRHISDGNTLTIKNTTEDDGGAYVCQGTNELGSVMAVIWIFVKDVGKL